MVHKVWHNRPRVTLYTFAATAQVHEVGVVQPLRADLKIGTWGDGDTVASRCWLRAEKPVDTAAGGAAEAVGAGGCDASDRALWMTVVCCDCSGCCACHMPSTCRQGNEAQECLTVHPSHCDASDPGARRPANIVASFATSILWVHAAPCSICTASARRRGSKGRTEGRKAMSPQLSPAETAAA
jgi:hypothetical protein